jgi:hypothetical protein
LAKTYLPGYGFLAVAVGPVDHDFFSNLAAYPVVTLHFSILTLYALGVTECHSITVMSTFVLPYYKDIWSIILFIIILAIIGFSSTCVWALFGSIFERVFREKKKLVNIIMALLLVYCAATIIITH